MSKYFCLETLRERLRCLIFGTSCCDCNGNNTNGGKIKNGITLITTNKFCCNYEDSVSLELETKCCEGNNVYIQLENNCCENSNPRPILVLVNECCESNSVSLQIDKNCCENFIEINMIDTCCKGNSVNLVLNKSCCQNGGSVLLNMFGTCCENQN